ncbi:response regulator transcription factor [Marinilabilia rubra]|uniref:HTH luxR-type domain-containing protein n=1 Tax=Marinilabilia rubra TaxID=2162893 RepID=A0A2U2B5E1_9BACT|nr:response regulator transcription factor [Marinilabilia rubra]PWD98254.1 hypothetical protein DDZ16_16615 [Marinilabilia rubra]
MKRKKLGNLENINIAVISQNYFFNEGLINFLHLTFDCRNVIHYDSSFEYIKDESQKKFDFVFIETGSIQKFDLLALLGCDFLRGRVRIIFVGNQHFDLVNDLSDKFSLTGVLAYKDPSITYIKALKILINGEKYISDNINPISSQVPSRDNNSIIKKLTPRELEVLKLLCQGLDAESLAERLCISPRTVVRHKTNILKKTGFSSTLQLVANIVDQPNIKEKLPHPLLW